MLFVSGAFVTRVEDLALAIREMLAPGTLVGSTAISVICGEKEIENQSAISIFAGNFDGGATPVRLADDVHELHDLQSHEALHGVPHTLVLLADPFSFPVENTINDLGSRFPDLQVIGGLASSTFLTLLVVPAAYTLVDDAGILIRQGIDRVKGTTHEGDGRGLERFRRKL